MEEIESRLEQICTEESSLEQLTELTTEQLEQMRARLEREIDDLTDNISSDSMVYSKVLSQLMRERREKEALRDKIEELLERRRRLGATSASGAAAIVR